MSSRILILLISLIACSHLCRSFELKRCDDGSWVKLNYLKIDACPGNKGASCQLKRATNYRLDAEFVTLKAFEAAKSYVISVKNGNKTIISKSYACDFYGLNCPSTDRQLQQLQETTYVSRDAQLGHLNYGLNLTTYKGDVIFCVEFPVEIVA